MSIPYTAKINNHHLSQFDKGIDNEETPKSGSQKVNKMSKLNELASEYVSPTTKNITELDLIPVDIEVVENTYERKEPKEGEEPTFKVLEIEVDGQKYRVPKTVLEQIKKILEMKPETENVSVGKEGTGFATKYTVVPM